MKGNFVFAEKLTRTNSMQSPVILILCWPTLTVYLYSPSDASFVDRLCKSTWLPPLRLLWLLLIADPNDVWPVDDCKVAPDVRLARVCVSSEFDDANELHEPAPATPPLSSQRTGDALRRIVSSIRCFA